MCVCVCRSFTANGFLPQVFLAGAVGDLDKWDDEQVNYCSQTAHRARTIIISKRVCVCMRTHAQFLLFLGLSYPASSLWLCLPFSHSVQISRTVRQPCLLRSLCLVYRIFRPPGAFWQTLALQPLCFSLTQSLGPDHETRGSSSGLSRITMHCLTFPYDFQSPFVSPTHALSIALHCEVGSWSLLQELLFFNATAVKHNKLIISWQLKTIHHGARRVCHGLMKGAWNILNLGQISNVFIMWPSLTRLSACLQSGATRDGSPASCLFGSTPTDCWLLMSPMPYASQMCGNNPCQIPILPFCPLKESPHRSSASFSQGFSLKFEATTLRFCGRL